MSFPLGISNLVINANSDGWGPLSGEKISIFENVPYAHFDKKERCFRVADFSQNPAYVNKQTNVRYQRNRDDRDGNVEFAFKYDAADDSTFHLVDSSKSQTSRKLGRKFYLIYRKRNEIPNFNLIIFVF